MAEPTVIDEVDKKKQLKRKRSSGSSVDPLFYLTSEEKSAKISSFREELKSLYNFYKELLVVVGKGNEDVLSEVLSGSGKSNFNIDSVIAVLLEESGLPLSKLVDEIFEKVKGKFGGDGYGVNGPASVKTKVLMIGQRMHYGMMNVDADILEDDSEATLWCWEVKDLKLLPKSIRDMSKIRRTCRKKIQERITAVIAMITALEKLISHQNCGQELIKASTRLSKTLGEADIRVIINMAERTGDEVDDKVARREDKLLVKQFEKNKRESEKERRKMEREQQKEKLQNEKELKRLQDEAEKEERRRQKEESEKKRLLKRQQEEAEKEQRRKEKEEAETKKQLALQKQASLMERFLKKCKTSSTTKNEQSPTDASDSSLKSNKDIHEPLTLEMDSILSTNCGTEAEEIWKLHLNSWRGLGHSICSNRSMHWGIRQKPKTDVVKELKLTTSKGQTRDDDMNIEKLIDGWVDSSVENTFSETNTRSPIQNIKKHTQSKQLLQFDKSHRPAFYGVWPNKSEVVNAHHPFAKDPELDYEIDSDEEWEEDEPGESLSDCDKDEEDESMEEGCSKGEEDEESEDGFFVPDGYLSENEGVEVEKVNSSQLIEEAPRSPTSKDTQQSEEILLLRRQKYLCNLTDHALRKNQPLIISNLMHEKTSLLLADDLTGVNKLEQMCLQALSICIFPCGPSMEISITNYAEEDLGACTSNSKPATTNLASRAAFSESDLPLIVSVIQSSLNGINKLVESLQEKFPSFSKSQLRNKVREISDFIDNRWQVKKDVLTKLGLAVSPEKSGGRRTKNIAAFFSKRCMPPSGKSASPPETSTQSSQKPIVTTPPLPGAAV